MAPSTILVVGSTGNTGRAVVQTLSSSLSKSSNSPRILALGRSADSGSAKKLAALPGVEFEEKDWTYIDADWVKERNVTKAFVASHNLPSHFFEESVLLLALRDAGVKYVVRISTTSINVKADTPVAYGRSHWALEQVLEHPSFDSLKWTSLQPDGFTTMGLDPIVNWVKEYKKTGKQTPLKVMWDDEYTVSFIHSDDVGTFAGHLLAADDFSRHHGQRYVLTGPSRASGKDLVQLVEKETGVKIDDVEYGSFSMFDEAVKHGAMPDKYAGLLKTAFGARLKVDLKYDETSEAVKEILGPMTTIEEVLKSMLKE